MIVLMPIGDVSQSILEGLVSPLEEAFRRKVLMHKPALLPSPAHDWRRSQYYGPSLLACLPAPDPTSTVLGVVDIDVYTPGLNFVFGLADAEQRRALICLKRLRHEFYGLPQDDKLFSERVLKEAIHELGHTYRLEHCDDPCCVMYFSNSLADTDRKSWDFCPTCRERMKAA